MAQSQSDIFSFLITPDLDISSVDDSSKTLQKKLEEVANSIAGEVSKALGKSFDVSGDINKAIKLIESLNGSVKRAGTDISASFKDATGNVRTFKTSLDEALKAASFKKQTVDKEDLSKIAASSNLFKQTGATYTGSEQIKEQSQVEKEIIQNLEKRYQYEVKIIDAKRQGNFVNKTYYENLKQQLATERQELEKQLNTQNTIATQNIANAEKQLTAKRDAYKQTVQDNDKLSESIKLLNQYESIQSKMIAEESAHGTGTEYYQQLNKQLQTIITSMESYGLEVDKVSGKVVFKDTATDAVKLKGNIDQVKTSIDKTNNSLDLTKAKSKDAFNYEQQAKQLKDFESALSKLVSTRQRMNQLESQGKTNTKEYAELTKQYEAAKSKLESYGATVTDTSVKIDQNSQIVNGNAEVLEKESKKCQEASDSLAIHKARSEDSTSSQNTFSQSIQSSVENFIKYQVAMEAINKITSEFTQAIGDMNGAMAQVRMVTMGSYEDTVALADSYTQLAKQLGTTTTEVAKGADTWL